MDLAEMCRQIAQGVAEGAQARAARMGAFLAHIRDVAGLPPEVAQLDCLVFEATIGGSVLTQAPNVKIPGGYYGELFGISGYISQPGVAVDNFPRITWNVKETGKRNVFGTDQSMAGLLNILGPLPPRYWPRSLYRFQPGADVALTFARATGWSTAGDNRTVGVELHLALVAADERDKERK